MTVNEGVPSLDLWCLADVCRADTTRLEDKR